MTALVDSSVLVDYLRGHPGAVDLLERERSTGLLHASEITRLDVLVGMRRAEEQLTRDLLSTFSWHAVDATVAEEAGKLGRRWLPSHQGIDGADLAIAATAVLLNARLLTMNVHHFPMFTNLSQPYEALPG